MPRPLLVGGAPPAGASLETASPLFPAPAGCAGHRLAEMTGLPLRDYLLVFDRMNLEPRPPVPGHVSWSAPRVRWAAINLLRGGLLSSRQVVLLGARVRRAFSEALRGAEVPLLGWRWVEEYDCSLTFVPHPSGRCRWYNDEANRRRATEFLAHLAEEARRRP